MGTFKFKKDCQALNLSGSLFYIPLAVLNLGNQLEILFLYLIIISIKIHLYYSYLDQGGG